MELSDCHLVYRTTTADHATGTTGTATLCLRHDWDRQKGNNIALMADGTETRLGEHLSGRMRITGQWFDVQVTTMRQMTYDVLLGMDILAPLGLTMTLNGTRIFPPSHASKGACAAEGPIPMDGLKPEEKRRVERFLKAQMGRLLTNKGVTPLIQHEIWLEDPTPIRQRYRPRNPATQRIIDEEVDKMLWERVILPSNSPWSLPIVITRRKDGKPKFCFDFRRLNKVSKKDAYPLPQVNATLDKLRGARYLSSIDLKNGYWHVPLTERSKPLTAFTVPGKGLFEFKVMPFGLHAATPSFQRLLDRVITPDMAPSAFAYLDDIVICTAPRR